jgi:hypothetical protein
LKDVDNTLLMQRLSAQLRDLEQRGPHHHGVGSSGGGSSLEPRVAKLEAHVDHIRSDVGELRGDLKTLLWAGIAGFVVTWGGIIGLALLMAKGFGWLK